MTVWEAGRTWLRLAAGRSLKKQRVSVQGPIGLLKIANFRKKFLYAAVIIINSILSGTPV